MIDYDWLMIKEYRYYTISLPVQKGQNRIKAGQKGQNSQNNQKQ